MSKNQSVLLIILALFIFFNTATNASVSISVWAPNSVYAVGDLVTYEGNTYSCLRAHTSQTDRTPSLVPVLWELYSDFKRVDEDSISPVPTQVSPGKLKWAGVRESYYGISENDKPFLTPKGWVQAMKSMASRWPGAAPVAIWLVSEVNFDTKGCEMQFPKPPGAHPRFNFVTNKVNHETYLDYFDGHGIKVFLQAEPGFADMNACIDLILNQFKHHPCVIGFGVDVEWYKCASDGGAPARVTDAAAKAWEKRVKSHNSSYKLFLKHYDKFYLCPHYRGDIIFIDDNEENGSFKNFLTLHNDFANFFNPAPVIYQIGYPSDKVWWGYYSDPPQTLGDALVAETKQDSCGIIWVDFGLRDILPYQ